MNKVLIICCGNPLRSDDGFGWRAAEVLARSLHRSSVEILTCFQLTPELVDALHAARCVFFIDASREGNPGELRFSRVTPAAEASSPHHLSPAAILDLTRQLYGSAPPALLASVSGESFEFGEHLSAKVEAELPRLTSLVAEAAELYGRDPGIDIIELSCLTGHGIDRWVHWLESKATVVRLSSTAQSRR